MRRVVPHPARLWTAQQLLDAGSRLERCELWDGVLCVREPAGGWAGPIAVAIAARLHGHVRQAAMGWVGDASTGFLVRRDPDRVLAPDVSFVSRRRLPHFPRRGFVPLAPDFAVEVRSPADSWLAVAGKCGVWIAHGARVVWAVDPDRASVVEFRPGDVPREVGPGGTASAEPAVEGFELRVADLFEGLEPETDETSDPTV